MMDKWEATKELWTLPIGEQPTWVVILMVFWVVLAATYNSRGTKK